MNKTIKNLIFNISYQVLNIIIPLITAPYIARVMKPEGVGIYSYSNSVAGYFALFMLLGIANYGSRTIAMNASKGKKVLSEKFWEMYIFQIAASIIGIAVFILFVAVSGGDYKTALYAQVFYLLSVALDISWYFAGTEQFKLTVVCGFLIKLMQTAAIFVFVKSSKDLLLYILIISVGTLLGKISLWIPLLKQISFEAITLKGVVKHIRPNLVLFIPLLASSVFVYMDKIMLGVISSSSDLGLYEYAEKIVRLPLTVISAIGAVMMPKVSALISSDDSNSAQKYMNISMRYISLLAAAMSFGIAAIAKDLSVVYLGEEFAECGLLMQVMSIIIMVSSFANIIRTQYLIPMKKDSIYAVSIVSAAVVNLILNIIFIPILGSIGAAIGTVGAEISVLAGHIIGVYKELPLKKYLSEWITSLLCGAVMLVLVDFATSFIPNNAVRLTGGIILGIAIFCILALFVLAQKKDDFILKIFRRRESTNVK